MSSRRKGKVVRVSRTYTNEQTSCACALQLLLKGGAGRGAGKRRGELTGFGEED
jgi:hypothetical protein